MTHAEWEDIYRRAWKLYYSPEHIETLLRRAVVTGIGPSRLATMLAGFASIVEIENLHPLQAGIFRLKRPSERRPGLPRESALVFWPRYVWDTLRKHAVLAGTIGRLVLTKLAIDRDPHAKSYMDEALTPVHDDGDVRLDLLTKTTGATAALAHIKKVALLTAAGRV